MRQEPKARCIVGARGMATWEAPQCPRVRDEVLLVPEGSSQGRRTGCGREGCTEASAPDTTASEGTPIGGAGASHLGSGEHGERGLRRGLLSVSPGCAPPPKVSQRPER